MTRNWLLGVGAMKAGTTTLDEDLRSITTAFGLPKEGRILHRGQSEIDRSLSALPKDEGIGAFETVSYTHLTLPTKA